MTGRAVDTRAPADAADAVQRLAALRRIAERGLVHGDREERAVAAAILGGLARGEANVADVLGLRGAGWTGAAKRQWLARRDIALRHLRRRCWAEESDHAAAVLLAAGWKRYAATRWPRDARAGLAPEGEPRATLYALLAAGHEPLSARRVREILARPGDAGGLPPVEPANALGETDVERRDEHA